ncbi:glutathione peroxidase, partial [Caulochytrium protostelioides]
YSLPCQSLDGQDVDLHAYKGQVILVVNMASKCGFTTQMTGLEAVYQQFKDEGFVVLGFPSDSFHQEHGSSEEIATVCHTKYQCTFPVMHKVAVNGKDTDPVFAWLKRQKSHLWMSRIKWNFEKFLLDRQGHVVKRYASTTTPESMAAEIKAML